MDKAIESELRKEHSSGLSVESPRPAQQRNLLPCPFCGLEFKADADPPGVVYNYSPFKVTCMNCVDDDGGIRVERWNTRTPQWQPIETAPKVAGQPLLIACATDEGWDIVTSFQNSRGHWIYDGEPTFCLGWYFEPKFWMPLPAAPEVNVTAVEGTTTTG